MALSTAPTMEATVRALVAPGRGILAADESFTTIEKRFASLGISSTEETRRSYREMLFTTPGVGEYISGAILFDETIKQTASDGTPFPELLVRNGILPGIKVDRGAKPMAGFPGETVTEGLDGLRERLGKYAELGARFAKWRAVITIGPHIPSLACLKANAQALARYASLCQENSLVPIVEPEVLMDGAHSILDTYRVTTRTLKIVFDELFEFGLVLEELLLKPNMVLPGQDNPDQATVDEVAERTLRCLYNVVPAAVPGVAFLSGGQSDTAATEHLNAMNARGPHPWEVSFSYARALQNAALRAWAGDKNNWPEAQAAFLRRARSNSAARRGAYTPEMELAPTS